MVVMLAVLTHTQTPGAKVVWGKVLAAVVPAVAAHPAVLTWDLANEPGFAAANSSYTTAAWSAHLEQAFGGNLSAASADWGLGTPLRHTTPPRTAPPRPNTCMRLPHT